MTNKLRNVATGALFTATVGLAANATGVGRGSSNGDNYHPTANQHEFIDKTVESKAAAKAVGPVGRIAVEIGDSPDNSTIWANLNDLVVKGDINPANETTYGEDVIAENDGSVIVHNKQILDFPVDRLPTPDR